MQQIQATIGQDYTIHIPSNKRGFKPGAKVSVVLKRAKEVSSKKDILDWIQKTRGIMTEAWKEIDTTAELEKMRSEWEDRLQEHEKAVR